MHATLPKRPAKMPSERSRSRRERRSDAARRPVLHVVMPGLEVARAEPRKGETVTAFLRRTGWAWRDRQYGWQFRKGLPTVLEINGEPLLRRHWSRKRIAANDNLRFVSCPLGGEGGSGKQILGLVALVAVSAFAFWAGPMVATALGFGGSALVGGLATAAIGLGGSLLVNALTAPKAGATNDPNATTDQIYTVQAQGNIAKLGQPLPVRYGREKVYPDFAATPWGEFVGNDQYINILLSQGMGSFVYEQMFISDTPLWDSVNGVSPSFSSAQIAFYGPGQNIDLFPVNVAQAAEVSGQQVPHGAPGAWLGPYIANPSGTKAYQLAVDFVFPAGCFTTDDKGNTVAYSVTLTAERQAVNDAGAPTGDWVTLASANRTYANRSPIRDTFLVGVPEGRYQVRFRRDTDVPEDNKGAAEVVWAGLRAYLRGNSSFPDVSTIAIRIKANESTQGSYKFGVLATRKLPVWHTDTAMFVTEATRNPFWAFLDAVTNPQYGSSHPLSKVDFNAIVNAAAAADARGDHFDYSFTSAVACPDAFDKILTPPRCRHFWLGDTISVVRDEWRDVPAMLLTDREIVRGSTQVTWTMLGEEDPDAVVIEYVDEDTWLPAQVQYPPETEIFTALNPETKRIDGVVNRDHAYRECAFYYLQSIYRRENVSIGTEYEGRAITFGQTIRVQSELPQNYGYGGAVMASAGTGGKTLTLDPAPSWADSGDHFVRLRKPNGKWFGPVSASRGANDNEAVLGSDLATVESQQGTTLAAVLSREDGGEYPSFELGTADNQSRVVKVLSGQPNGNLCTLNMVVDDIRVHETDLGNPPVLPIGQFPSNNSVPLIILLTASFGQGVAEPVLRASWVPSAGAFYYRGEVSYDDGKTWSEVYEGQSNSFEKIVTLGALRLRVQAVGQFPGPYSEVDVEAPTIEIMSNSVAFNSLNDAVKFQTTQLLDSEFSDLRKAIAKAASVAAEALARTNIDKKEVRSQQVSLFKNNKASIETVATTAADAQTAVADLTTAVAVEVGDLNDALGTISASVTENSSAIADLDGYAAAKWSVAVAVDGSGNKTVAGLVLFNDSDSVSSFTVTANKFFVAFPGQTGGASVPVFTIANVGGVAKLALRGDMIIDGSIITQMIAAGAVTAVTIQAGSINTSQLAINSVGIDQIIANAVTNTKVFSTAAANSVASPANYGAIGPPFFSQVVNIQSGTALIQFSATNNRASETTTSPRQTSTIALLVNGSVVRDWTWLWNQVGSNTSIFGTIDVQWAATGLPAGNNTIAIAASSYNTEGSPAAWESVQAGQIFIADFRR